MTLWKLALCAAVAAVIAAPALAADIEGPMLNAHNAARAKHGVPPLSWSASLAKAAQAWADRCVFEHSSTNYGENLAQGTGDFANAVPPSSPVLFQGQPATTHARKLLPTVWQGHKSRRSMKKRQSGTRR